MFRSSRYLDVANTLPKNRIPTHPGKILLDHFMHPMGLSQVHLGIPAQRVNEIVKGRRGVTPETAWLLAQAFDTTPDFWINLQTAHDLAKARPVKRIRRVKAAG